MRETNDKKTASVNSRPGVERAGGRCPVRRTRGCCTVVSGLLPRLTVQRKIVFALRQECPVVSVKSPGDRIIDLPSRAVS